MLSCELLCKTVYCPDPKGGDLPLTITSPKFCHVENQANDASSTIIGCSSSGDEFCFVHPLTKTSISGRFYASGHCCPMLTSATKLTSPVCPVNLENKVFGHGNTNCEKCDRTMEKCVSFKIWNTEMSYTYV
uniref:Uncharacterized protein n=1 Tax=Romanomermis culicivorax TaxID=13658 RepID=A0A915K581_ROMCU